MPKIATLTSRIIVKWFVIGFTVRLALAAVVTLLITKDLEASMLYFADLPTIFCLEVVERIVSNDLAARLSGSHPYYIQLNLLGACVWGVLFVLARLIVAAARGKLSPGKIFDRSLSPSSPRNLDLPKTVGSLHQSVDDAGFGNRVPGIWDDL